MIRRQVTFARENVFGRFALDRVNTCCSYHTSDEPLSSDLGLNLYNLFVQWL
jgi:hypothetical protein